MFHHSNSITPHSAQAGKDSSLGAALVSKFTVFSGPFVDFKPYTSTETKGTTKSTDIVVVSKPNYSTNTSFIIILMTASDRRPREIYRPVTEKLSASLTPKHLITSSTVHQ